jgi:hypothetical protein
MRAFFIGLMFQLPRRRALYTTEFKLRLVVMVPISTSKRGKKVALPSRPLGYNKTSMRRAQQSPSKI